MVIHYVLLNVKRLVMALSSPTPNAHLVHVEIVAGPPGPPEMGASEYCSILKFMKQSLSHHTEQGGC